MKKSFCCLFTLSCLLMLSSCEELFSQGMESEAIKKLRSENTGLKIQVDKLQRQINTNKDEVTTKNIIIALYDLRHAVEKFALENNSNYPEAENLVSLTKIIQPNLPKDFSLDSTYIETVKSTKKGYIFIANIGDQKVVVSNLI